MTIEINMFWIVFFAVLAIFLFLLHNFGGTNLFIKKDIHIADKFLDKFPLVSPEFMNKSAKEQTLENNQEIQEILKKLDEMQKKQSQTEDAIRTFAKIAQELRERG